MTNPPPRPPVWLLVGATATGPLALNMFVPSMPGLPEAFQTTPAAVQLTLSLFLVGVAVGQLVYGPLSDRFGRRPVLLSGLALYAAAGLFCLLAPTIELLVAGRVAQALGGCAGMVIARAIVRDAWGRDEATRVLALVIAGMALAPMFGPAVGGFLDELVGWRATFAALLVFGAVVAAWGARALPETHLEPTPLPGLRAMLAAYRGLLARRLFLGYALVTALTTAGFFAFLAGAPFTMMDTLGRPPSEYGLMFILLSVGYMGGNMAVSRLAGRVPPDALLAAGLVMCVAGPAALLWIVMTGRLDPWTLFLPTIVMCTGNGLVMPTAMTVAVGIDPRLAGTASGLLGFLQMGVGAAASASVGALKGDDPTVMVAAMLALNALAAVALACGRRSARRIVPSPSASGHHLLDRPDTDRRSA